MNPNLPIDQITGIGKYYSYKLKRLGIKKVEDLIYHFPFRYDDFSQTVPIQNLTTGIKMTISGVVWQIKNIRTRSGKILTIATIADQSGVIDAIWFNQPYLPKIIKSGIPIALSGKVEQEGRKFKMLSPSYELLRIQRPIPDRLEQKTTLHTGRLVPVYPETEGLSSKWIRSKISQLLPKFLEKNSDFLPDEIISRQKLITLTSALNKIHFPKNLKNVDEARKRLGFDELFLLQLLSQIRKREWQEEKKAPKIKINLSKTNKLIKKLPFILTSAQKKALDEILQDLNKAKPANRLLEGDVGSGKTVVGAIAAYNVILNGYDVLIAAPTEILAFQHQKTLSAILAKFGIEVGIWTKSNKTYGKLTCGTHALLTSFTPEGQLGLVIVDEQHRFGVAQRAKLFLSHSKHLTPHLLTMTATPIPRTLALTIYGDLDLSVLDEMPRGRQKIATFVVPNQKRESAYQFIAKQIKEGRQTFIITPFIEPSETMATVKAATAEFENLKKKFLPKIKLGLLHGKLKSKDKEKIINNFKKGYFHILVSTPVVEVGIDVPNATIMMIESAERFGLAQLHQLRGRVGRSEHKSYCLLFTQSESDLTIKRLKSMEKVSVGFELAEIDLKLRGPGEFYGVKQSGFINFKIANLADHKTINTTQQEVERILQKDPNLKDYPVLKEKIAQLQSEYIQPN